MKDPAANRSTRSQSRKHRNNGVFVHKEPPSCRPLPLQSFRPRPDSSASQRSSSFVKNGTTHPKAEPIISGTEDECAEIPVRLPLAEQSPAKELKNSAAPLPALKYNKNAVAIGLGELNFSFETRRGLPDTQEEHECLRPLIRGDAGESIEERMRRAIERVGGTGIEGEVRDAYFEGEANYKRCRNRLFGQGKRSVNRETVHRRARSVARGTGNKVSPRPKMRRGKPLLSESLRSIYQPDAPSRRPRNNPQKRPAFIHHARHRSLAAPVPSRLIPEHDTPAASYEQEFAARFPCFAPSPGVDWADSTLYRNIREGIFSAAKRDIMEELGLNASRRHANTHERLRDVRGSLVQIFILVNERDVLPYSIRTYSIEAGVAEHQADGTESAAAELLAKSISRVTAEKPHAGHTAGAGTDRGLPGRVPRVWPPVRDQRAGIVGE